MPRAAKKNAEGPSWQRRLAAAANGDLVSALDGNWGGRKAAIQARRQGQAASGARRLSEADVQQATRDSVRALMMIRAYRMRGHLHANLDPLGIKEPTRRPNSTPATYGFTEADWTADLHRQRAGPRIRHHARDARRSCEAHLLRTLGVEFMHISDPEAEGWIQERIEGPDKEIASRPRARRRSSTS
jgi:2-oxoglutarate dehydrogenase E1 component